MVVVMEYYIYCERPHFSPSIDVQVILKLDIYDWCKQNFININVQKTKLCIYGYRSRVKTFGDTSIGSGVQQVLRCQQYNYLGVLLDECMTLRSNFNSIFKKFSHKIYQFGKIRKYINTSTRVLVYKQTILPLTEYVSFRLCLNTARDVETLQKLQNRCLRMCLDVRNPRDMSIDYLHNVVRIKL